MGSQGNAKKWKLQTISTYKRTTGDKLSGRERKQKKGTPMGVAFLPHLRTGSGSGFGEWKKKSIMAFFRLRWYWNLFEVPVSEKKKEKNSWSQVPRPHSTLFFDILCVWFFLGVSDASVYEEHTLYEGRKLMTSVCIVIFWHIFLKVTSSIFRSNP